MYERLGLLLGGLSVAATSAWADNVVPVSPTPSEVDLIIAKIPPIASAEGPTTSTTGAPASFEEFSEDYPYADIISEEVGYCYKRLINDSSCCLDQEYPRGVARRALRRPGTEWTCGKECLDSTKGMRGEDTLWVPVGASCSSPRILWVHGGSWEYGSPLTLSYGQLCAKLASKTGAVVMALDYPLAPLGNYTSILTAARAALVWLADAPLAQDPFFLGGDCRPGSAPLFVGGDSSGGGTALSLVLTLKKLGGWSPHGIRDSHVDALPHGQMLAGAIFFSPWTNLRCDTPDYYYNAFAKIVATRRKEKSTAAPASADEGDSSVYVGDLMFRGKPKQNLDEFTANAKSYTGGEAHLLVDPVASPFYAGEEELGGGGIPPLYFAVGGSESILGDSLIIAQKAAFYGADVYLDVNVGMWHDFPMYSEGCGTGKGLWQAVRTLNRTAEFVMHAAAVKRRATELGLLWPPSSGQPGTPHTSYVYDLTRQDTALWFPKHMIMGRHFGFGDAVFAAMGPASQGHLSIGEWVQFILLRLSWMGLGAVALAVVQTGMWRLRHAARDMLPQHLKLPLLHETVR